MNHGPIITDRQVEALFHWLNERSEDYGRARGAAIRTAYRVDIVEAKLILRSEESSDAKRKAWARSQAEYIKACEDHAQAEEDWENAKEASKKFQLLSEVWRTLNANDRTMMRATR